MDLILQNHVVFPQFELGSAAKVQRKIDLIVHWPGRVHYSDSKPDAPPSGHCFSGPKGSTSNPIPGDPRPRPADLFAQLNADLVVALDLFFEGNIREDPILYHAEGPRKIKRRQ